MDSELTPERLSSYRTVSDIVGDAFIMVDGGQRIVLFNPAAERVFGFLSEEVVGYPLSRLLPDRFRPGHEVHVEAFGSTEREGRRMASDRASVVGLRKNGDEFTAEVTLSVLDVDGEAMFAAVVRDVSARVATEQALVASVNRFRTVFEDSPVATALVGLDGYFFSGNQAFADQTGFSLPNLEGMPMADLVDPDDRELLTKHFDSILGGRARTARMELRQRRADATIQVIDLNLALVENEMGDPDFMIGQSIDITERIRSQAQLEELVRSKDEFIASVSHELRTPLTAVLGFAQLLRDEDVDLLPDERSELIRSIAEEGFDLAYIVEDLLVAAKAETGTLQAARVRVNLGAQAAQVLESWNRPEVAHIELVGSSENAVGDPARVRQVLRNLLSNAIRYGGDRIQIRFESSEETTKVAVCDNGPAIAPDDIDRIFEPYQRAHDRPGLTASLGIGLPISRQLAKLMDGDLTYRYQQGENCFELALPKAQENPTAVEPSEAPTDPGA